MNSPQYSHSEGFKYEYKVDYKWIKTYGKLMHQYDLNDPAQRVFYFKEVVGDEIQRLNEYFENNSFIAYLLAPKNAGKSTYVSMLKEIFGGDKFDQIIVGDLVRNAHLDYEANGKNSETYKYVEKNFRGFMSIDEAFEALMSRNAATPLPTEFILTLVKKAIDTENKKTLFIDGFPRMADQISYSLYFRELINYREDPDCFVMIDLPVGIIDERIKYRRLCPKCKNSKNLILNPSTELRYDKSNNEYYMLCDNPECNNERLVSKEGDELGIKVIEHRILSDQELMQRARGMYGIPKIELFNGIDKSLASEMVTPCELTEKFVYSTDENGNVIKNTEPFTVLDEGKEYYSLKPAPVTVQLIRQLDAIFCSSK